MLKVRSRPVHLLCGSLIRARQANHLFMFFPLAGAGGRLGVHRIADTGRLPTAIHSIVAGATIVDYELDPFDPTRVFVACEHSRIRSYRIPQGGLEEDWSEVDVAMVGESFRLVGGRKELIRLGGADSGMDRIGDIQHHPTAKDLLLSVSDDHGEPTLRLWDVGKRTVLLRVALPAGGVGPLIPQEESANQASHAGLFNSLVSRR